MSDTDQNLDNLLRAANPVAEDRLPLPSESPGAQLLYEEITGTPYAGGAAPRRVRRPPWVGPGMAALIALAAGGAAGAYAIANHLTTRLAVKCYAASTLQSTALAVSAESDGPVATCSHAWAKGNIGTGRVPLLVACLTPEGVAAVFPSAPGADVCGQLGLPALPAGATSLSTTPSHASPSTTATSQAMPLDLRDAIVNVLRTSCFRAAEAEAAIARLITKSNVHWTVITPSPFPAGRPCASPAFDENRHQVVLTGLPGPPTSAP